ncbi:hypothetical protein D3C80_2062260 [compost metagenome]
MGTDPFDPDCTQLKVHRGIQPSALHETSYTAPSFWPLGLSANSLSVRREIIRIEKYHAPELGAVDMFFIALPAT